MQQLEADLHQAGVKAVVGFSRAGAGLGREFASSCRAGGAGSGSDGTIRSIPRRFSSPMIPAAVNRRKTADFSLVSCSSVRTCCRRNSACRWRAATAVRSAADCRAVSRASKAIRPPMARSARKTARASAVFSGRAVAGSCWQLPGRVERRSFGAGRFGLRGRRL